MRAIRFSLTTLAALLLVLPLAMAADEGPAKNADASPVALFDGKTLAGWVVTGCKAAVEDGKLVTLEGNGFVRTENQYGDFVLELEFKPRKDKAWDSGIYIRSGLPPKFKSWPAQWQVNLLEGHEGEMVGHTTGKSAGLGHAAGEWSSLKISAVGKKVEVEVNGKKAYTVDDIEPAVGYIGIQVEAPNGGQFEFRNIHIMALTPPVPPQPAPGTGAK